MRKLLPAFVLALLCQINSAQEVRFQTGHTHDILKVKFSPDDRQLISYSAGDGRLCLWDVEKGHLLWMTRTEFIQKGTEYYNLQEFYWSKDGRFVVTKSHNGTYQSWDSTTGKILDVSGKRPDIMLIAEQPGKLPVNKDVEDFNVSNPKTKEVFKVKSFSRTANVYDLSHDGRLFAEGGSWGNAAIKLTEIKTGESRFLDGHPGVVKAIAYSPDGRYVAVGGSDKNVYVFDVANRALAKTLAGHTRPLTSIAFSPNGKIVLSASKDSVLKAWNWQEGKLLRDFKSAEDSFGIQSVAFSPDGKYVLTTSDRVEFRLWDAERLQIIRSFKTRERYESTSGQMTIGYDAVPVSSAVFTKDGKRIVSGHVDGTVRIWDCSQGTQIKGFKIGDSVSIVKISPDGETILAAIDRSDKMQIKLVDAQRGSLISGFDDDHTRYIEALSLSPNGMRFATSSIAGQILLWDITRREPVRTLDTDTSGVEVIEFSPDGKTLAIGGTNQNLVLIDVDKRKRLWQLIPPYQPSELERSLTKAGEEQRARIDEANARRDRRAAIDTEVFKNQINISFDHYGDMTDPGEQRIMESGVPNKSRVKKSRADANAVWLRLNNDSPLPIEVPTQSMYLSNPKCFFEFSAGNKILGLCDGREISVWFGLEDKSGTPVPYGFDFGSSAILLPKTSVLFAVPLEVLQDGRSIRFDFTFQAETDDRKSGDYGTPKALRFSEADLHKIR